MSWYHKGTDNISRIDCFQWFWVFSLNFPLFPNALKGLDDGVGGEEGGGFALLRPHPLLTHNLYQQYKQYSRRFPIIFNLQNKKSITVR